MYDHTHIYSMLPPAASHRPFAALGLVFLHDQCYDWFIPQMHGPIHTCIVQRIRSDLSIAHIQSLCY